MKTIPLNSMAGTLALGLGLLCTPAVQAAPKTPARFPASLAGAGVTTPFGGTKSIGSQAVLNALSLSFSPVAIPGATRTDAYGISNNKVVAGFYQPPTGELLGYISNGRSYTTINPPGSTATFCYAVNTSGKAVGAYYGLDETGLPVFKAFSYQNGVYTDLQPSGAGGPATESGAFGVNDLGDVCGYFVDSLGQHGFIYKNGTYTVLDIPGMTGLIAFGINNQDVTTIQAADANGFFSGYVYRNGTLTSRNVPGALNSFIHGINDAGTIVYSYQTEAGGHFFGKAYYKGRYIDVVSPDSTDTYADGVNNSSAISGNAFKIDGSYGGFIATPAK